MSLSRALVLVFAACNSTPAKPDAPSSAWSLGPSLPLPRIEPGVTGIGLQLVVLGGFDTDQAAGLDVTKQVDTLDTGTCPKCTWAQFPDAPIAVHHAQLGAVGTTIYLLGGLDGTPDAMNNFPARGDTYRLDVGDTTTGWEQLAPMPPSLARGSAAVVAVPPRIYLFGGANATSALATNIYYDTSSNKWCPNPDDPTHDACPTGPTVPDLPAARSHPAAMRRADGAFVVTGGLSGLTSDTAVADTWQLPAGATAWMASSPLPEARGGCAFGVVEGELVCAGGEGPNTAFHTTDSYDSLTDTWYPDEMMPVATAGTQGAAIAAQLYVPGGSRQVPSLLTSFTPTDTLYIYSPLNTAQP